MFSALTFVEQHSHFGHQSTKSIFHPFAILTSPLKTLDTLESLSKVAWGSSLNLPKSILVLLTLKCCVYFEAH